MTREGTLAERDSLDKGVEVAVDIFLTATQERRGQTRRKTEKAIVQRGSGAL